MPLLKGSEVGQWHLEAVVAEPLPLPLPLPSQVQALALAMADQCYHEPLVAELPRTQAPALPFGQRNLEPPAIEPSQAQPLALVEVRQQSLELVAAELSRSQS